MLTVTAWIIIVWIVGILSAILFFYGGNRTVKLFKESITEDSIWKDQNVEYHNESKKCYKRYLIKVIDKTNVSDLEALGKVLYVSQCISLIGFECIPEMVKYLEKNPNVINIQEEMIGSFLSENKGSETYV